MGGNGGNERLEMGASVGLCEREKIQREKEYEAEASGDWPIGFITVMKEYLFGYLDFGRKTYLDAAHRLRRLRLQSRAIPRLIKHYYVESESNITVIILSRIDKKKNS